MEPVGARNSAVLTRDDAGPSEKLHVSHLVPFPRRDGASGVRSRRSEDLEIIVLRHQLAVLSRQIDRPELAHDDRSLLGASLKPCHGIEGRAGS